MRTAFIVVYDLPPEQSPPTPEQLEHARKALFDVVRGNTKPWVGVTVKPQPLTASELAELP